MKRIFREGVVASVLLMLSVPCFSKADWYITAGGGEQYPRINSSMTVNNVPGFSLPYGQGQDIYSTSSGHPTVFDLSVGRRWKHQRMWFPACSIGVSYQHVFSSNVGDTITQYSDPTFTNYNYEWDISSDILLAALKVNIVQWSKFSPYLTGGIGGAFNQASNYNETALPGLTATRDSAGFASNTTRQFAYVAGAGIDFQMTEQVLLSLEYQYQNLGNVSSGKGTDAWTSQSLNLGSYHSNTVLLNATYLIGK